MAAVPELNRRHASSVPTKAAHSLSSAVISGAPTPPSTPRSRTPATAAWSSGRMSGQRPLQPLGDAAASRDPMGGLRSGASRRSLDRTGRRPRRTGRSFSRSRPCRTASADRPPGRAHVSRTQACARVVARAPGALAGAGHHVEVVQVVAGRRHRRPVPAVRDQDDVAGPDRRRGRSIGRSACRTRAGTRGPARAARRRRCSGRSPRARSRPSRTSSCLCGGYEPQLPPGRQDLDGDQAIGLEPVRRGEVADLAGARAGAAQLDADRRRRRRSGPGSAAPRGLPRRRTVRRPALATSIADARRRVDEIASGRPRRCPAGQPVGARRRRSTLERAGERQHGDLVGAGLEGQRADPARASPTRSPENRQPADSGRQDDGPTAVRERPGRSVRGRPRHRSRQALRSGVRDRARRRPGGAARGTTR